MLLGMGSLWRLVESYTRYALETRATGHTWFLVAGSIVFGFYILGITLKQYTTGYRTKINQGYFRQFSTQLQECAKSCSIQERLHRNLPLLS